MNKESVGVLIRLIGVCVVTFAEEGCQNGESDRTYFLSGYKTHVQCDIL